MKDTDTIFRLIEDAASSGKTKGLQDTIVIRAELEKAYNQGREEERNRIRESKALLPTVHEVARAGYAKVLWEVSGKDFLDHLDNK